MTKCQVCKCQPAIWRMQPVENKPPIFIRPRKRYQGFAMIVGRPKPICDKCKNAIEYRHLAHPLPSLPLIA